MTLQVFGGASPFSVITADLRTAASQLRHIAENLTAGTVHGFDARTAAMAPEANQPGVRLKLTAVEQTQRECTRMSENAQHSTRALAQSLELAAGGYERAERAATAIPESPLGASPSMSFRSAWELLSGMATSDPPGLFASARGMTEALLFRLLALGGSPSLDIKEAAEEMLRVTPVPVIEVLKPQEEGESPTDVGLPQLIDLQASSERGPGAIVVTRTGSAEHPTWIVTLPGTNMASGGVWGAERILDAVAGKTDAVRKAVETALDSVGAKAGDGLVLNGHSQGGRHALNLASDAELRGKYKISGVFTAGAPSGGDPIPTDVSVIQLEDPEDPVPGLDGQAGVPVGLNRMLIRGNAGKASGDGNPGPFGRDHGLENYRKLAVAAATDGRASIKNAERGLGLNSGQSKSYRVPTRRKYGGLNSLGPDGKRLPGGNIGGGAG